MGLRSLHRKLAWKGAGGYTECLPLQTHSLHAIWHKFPTKDIFPRALQTLTADSTNLWSPRDMAAWDLESELAGCGFPKLWGEGMDGKWMFQEEEGDFQADTF